MVFAFVFCFFASLQSLDLVHLCFPLIARHLYSPHSTLCPASVSVCLNKRNLMLFRCHAMDVCYSRNREKVGV